MRKLIKISFARIFRRFVLTAFLVAAAFCFFPLFSMEVEEHISSAAETARNDPQKALEAINGAALEHPKSGEIIIFRGMIYFEKLNDYVHSQKDFNDGILLLGDNPEKGRYLELIDELTTSFATHEVFDYFNRSYSLIEMGDFRRAVELLQRSVSMQDNNARLYYELAYAYVELNDFENAEKNIEAGYRLNPVSMNILEEMKFIYVKTGNIAKLRTTIDSITRLYGKDPSLQLDLAEGYSTAKDDQGMVVVLLDTIREYPDYSYSYFTLGEYYYKSGRFQEAVPYLNKYIEKTSILGIEDSRTRSDINKTLRRAREMIDVAAKKP